MSNCHCPDCRKASGGAFATTAICRKSDFSYTSGEAFIRSFERPGEFTRYFCVTCGSTLPIPEHDAFRGCVGIPAGLLDVDPRKKPTKHLFTGSKAPWWDILDDHTQFETWHPGYAPPPKA